MSLGKGVWGGKGWDVGMLVNLIKLGVLLFFICSMQKATAHAWLEGVQLCL